MPNFYVVFSSRLEDYPEMELFLKDYVMHHIPGKVLLHKEYGETGNHPHLNLICTEAKSPSNYNRTWKDRLRNGLGDQFMNRNHKIVKCSETYDLDKLINGYLKKEKRWEVIYQRKMNIIDPERVRHAREAKELQKKINLQIEEIYPDRKELLKKPPVQLNLQNYMQEFLA